MRFRFLGDLDCPDWLLAEIAILARISALRFKFLCVEVVNSILGGEINYERVNRSVADANFELSDIKASVAAVHHIFRCGGQFDVDETTLGKELQQLGLPKENSDQLCRVYTEQRTKLRQRLIDLTLSLPRLTTIEWRVDHLLSSSKQPELNVPVVQLRLGTRGAGEQTIEIDAQKFKVLYHELKTARALMASSEV
eukprot:gnl/Hemi2/5471_TR1881_c0_g6_i1.p1 gnl/Hemi2/5471_TR1881_c0_g6~~gnl/Hemi2/5471_TR1881_c0_g6_i1.p1  ORF type:complete len:196 (-),score=21.70 gnl/Hemi2/5471_TR1881_c0_g6_i1:186-773(-)